MSIGLGFVFFERSGGVCSEDRSCSIPGGHGWMTSAVARDLVIDRPGMTAGVGLRAIVFPFRPGDRFSSGIVLAAFDFAFGRPAGVATPSSQSAPEPVPRLPLD